MKKVVITIESVDDGTSFYEKYKPQINFIKTKVKRIVALLIAIVLIVVFLDFFVIKHEYILNTKSGNVHSLDCNFIVRDNRCVRYNATAFKVLISGYGFCPECISYF